MTHNLTDIAVNTSYVSEKSYLEALNVRIAVLIPDRGDRPNFTNNCLQLINEQTLYPVKVFHVNEPPQSLRADITYRYRIGYNLLSNLANVDLIAFIENDDYYAPNYLQTMAAHWIEQGKPEMIGTCYSWYYHIGLLKYTKLEHYTRSAAMNTLIVPGLKIKWCADTEPYTDMHLWTNCPEINKTIVNPENIISIGLKHGVGKCGGGSHVDRLNKYKHTDQNMEWLFKNVDPKFHSFYTQTNAKLHGKY